MAQGNGDNQEDLLQEWLSQLTLKDETNILLLGETGVGKSTFINSFINVFTYGSLDKAQTSNTRCLVPCKFTVTDENYESIVVSFGKDRNECWTTGSSSTQKTRFYKFNVGSKIIRLIDTPGIADTRGIEVDRKNFEEILRAISSFSNLQGIIILLKPNDSRLSIVFRFCILELLSHLHKDASRNIVFVFTHARQTSYKPGETLVLLRKMMEDIRNKPPYIDIPLNKSTLYCLDSETFRFLLASKAGIKFDEGERISFKESWQISVKECRRLMMYIAGLKPHSVQDTISLNSARSQIIALSKPLADISINIQNNLKMLKDQKIKIENAGNSITDLEKLLYVPALDLVPKKFAKPRTVCASPSCYKVYTIQGIRKIDYVQVCHDPCELDDIEPEIIDNAGLRKCSAIQDSTGECYHCKCHWSKHMHVYYENQHVTIRIVDEEVKNQLLSQKNLKSKVENQKKELEARAKQLRKELDLITSASAQFTHYLTHNSITPYNDAQLQYMDYMIKNQEAECGSDEQKKAMVQHLKAQRVVYQKELELLESKVKEESNQLAQIDSTMKNLYALPINGRQLVAMSRMIWDGRNGELHDQRQLSYDPNEHDVRNDNEREFCVLM